MELDFDAPYIIVVDSIHAPTKPNPFILDRYKVEKTKT